MNKSINTLTQPDSELSEMISIKPKRRENYITQCVTNYVSKLCKDKLNIDISYHYIEAHDLDGPFYIKIHPDRVNIPDYRDNLIYDYINESNEINFI